MITIRSIERTQAPDHAEELVDLWTRTFVDAYHADFSPENIDAYCRDNFAVDTALDLLRAPGTRVGFADRDGAAVGFYLIRFVECPVFLPGASAELKQIYVLAPEYGKGTGKELLAHARERVLATGRSWMWLFVADMNERAKTFYKHMDFERISPGPAVNVGTDRVPTSLMARCL